MCVSLLSLSAVVLLKLKIAELPTSRELAHPIHVYEGDDALITCVVRSLGSNTVIWKRAQEGSTTRWKVLTAGHERVTLDTRVQVIHDQGGQEMALGQMRHLRKRRGRRRSKESSATNPEIGELFDVHS
ncbi:hypothetical protein AAG570_003605 [Ranatra chinensis]|uniref:Ig-like domain-containing protein n=1 Tax=Ranatra chinensis TaxID=642074 RepID=A0ABD0Y466_9HEMI